jgi:hypothetical protein
MRAQASLEFLLIGSAVAAMCLFVVTFYSHSLLTQAGAISSLADSTANTSYYATLSGFSSLLGTTGAQQPNATPQQSYAVQISNRSEYIKYGLGSPSYLVNMTQFSHCVYLGFFGHPFNISGQCGTSNAWYYFSGYGCQAQDGAFCIVPHNSSYYVLETNGSRGYAYGFTLELSTPYGTMQARLSSNASVSAILLAGSPVGSAEVSGVSSTEAQASATVLGGNATQSLANQTAYSAYEQSRNMLYPMLKFYNGTSADSATQASIEQAVAYFNSTERALVAGSTQQAACEVKGGEYACAATSPFLYAINVTLGPSFPGVNETLYYLGSEVSVRG